MAKLYILPTPIGNLEDITLRTIRILKEVDLVLAEDTRVSSKLLKHYNINKSMMSFHQHNEHAALEKVIERLMSGLNIALITDAGTPGISDPGFLIVRECHKHHIEVETLPGATAFIPALVNSGLPCDTFTFEGFLPVKKGKKTKMEKLASETRTMIFYESPHRIVKTLDLFTQYFGRERQASVSRELTKLFEENKRGTLEELKNYFAEGKTKGEFVIVVEGYSEKKKRDAKKK